MKGTFKAALLAVAILPTASMQAQTVQSPLSDKVLGELNNFSYEMQACQVYNLAAFQCLGQKDPKLAAQIRKTADAFSDLAINSAKIVGLSEKAILARSDILAQEMKDDINSNCINISVLLNKYAKRCKVAMETSNARIERIFRGQ